MTAVSLLDILSRKDGSSRDDDVNARDRVERLATQLVQSSLDDWDRIRRYELEFASGTWDAAALNIERSIHGLFGDWAADAEQVLARISKLVAGGSKVAGADQLEKALGRTRTQLKLTPAKIDRAMEQIREGKAVPVKEMRDELHARLRS